MHTNPTQPSLCSVDATPLEPTGSPLVELSKAAIAAWDAYKATGLHATHAEADAWLAQLEAGNEVEPPVCHV